MMVNNLDNATYQKLAAVFATRIEQERIITQEAKRLAYGTDASFYRLVPKIVLRLKDLQEVIFAIQSCRELHVPCTFRAAGTSLSGQAVSDSVLITLTDDWRGHEIVDDGNKIILQPGVIGADANRYLAPFQRKIGPDPASINTCKIGGIAANNASGMCCGTAQNSYRTVDSMKIVFSDGTILNTADEASIAAFKQSHASLVSGIEALCQQVADNKELSDKIKHKYRLKNTTGYALNALVDYQDPIEVIEHLMIGSEGTLGFIAEITYNTVIEHPNKASALLVFATIEEACRAVTTLSKLPVAAVELMDGRAMRSVADKAGMPSFIQSLDLEAAAILVESHASCQTTLDLQCKSVMDALAEYTIIESVPFTSDAATVATLWGIRKGMFPAVGAVREVGTTVIIEDVAFPVENLANGVRDLQALFDRFQYGEAIIFGHALEGNLHFVFTQGFDSQTEIDRYGKFMDEVAELVAVKYQGSLKAEHGTGRNMAPYVELEWGREGYQLMQQIKTIFDPQGLLNPGVIINDNPHSHIENLKPMPAADPLVDRCIECGFCEPVCPSRTLTLSPRQRIVLYRELQRRERAGEKIQASELEKVFEYQGIDTCAATGLCAERCPVGINTGDLVKKLRTAKYQKFTPIAKWTADHFSTTTAIARNGLRANQLASKVIGAPTVGKLTNGLRSLTKGSTPIWYPEYPTANQHSLGSSAFPITATEKKVVYMPSCASRNMGQQADAPDQRPLTEVTLSLIKKAGYEVIIPAQLSNQCCGMPYDSKGMNELATNKARQLEEVLWQASREGTYPVLMDTSPCAKRSIEQFSQPMEVLEPTGFVSKYLLPHLDITPLNETVMLHVTCSSRRMGLENAMITLANACASRVIVPEHIQCCGWAGDKGFTTPELNAAAVHPLKAQVPSDCQRGFSNSRTCEIGLSHHSGIPYQSILYLVDDASSPR
ncbi:TPA: FAD-binding and (Fe-S)-binding domain-containing protein [Vibrio vulnificus]|uniref:D-lactate dehydrogenase (cytochrome) n=1 Tax=Vibrio vulnificus (strain CMCP6) TaxID=216895 RepID=A0A3Q0KYV8_VIBVU|nr:FAD-binding and (Fe-S)-binding domain-containing protein [Vibrio vulnificus]AAO07727.1 Predicted D-lactate dehydrogenase, Fe-S protein, FAD/FMN-containing [Vibrio vulnificus CMCP6]EIO3937080.1 FAD-binding oxidoreductase [Vibrio vulnificus]EKZ9054210.1 FAD-binding oxidoreductase [Vibrio vulnificus]QBN15813.1 FAD-binding oxidoreductase [Vibrio vulnificus]HDY7467420.1 FAD-binding oxidoreductase [Vibrio vulnificus]